MLRKIIKIDENKCNGCAACARACHEGAIEMVDGVARLTREDYCDGLGDCLPACPTGAISFELREAPEYDREAVEAAMAKKKSDALHGKVKCPGTSCPGSAAKVLQGKAQPLAVHSPRRAVSQLMQWPCQIKLVPPNAPYFDGADLLIAADCTAYAYAAFHEEMMRGRITLIGCPKLDATDYTVKLLDIIKNNDIKSIRLARMEVPCCGGLEIALKRAVALSGKELPVHVITVTTDGRTSE